jgi:hypothetical protein
MHAKFPDIWLDHHLNQKAVFCVINTSKNIPFAEKTLDSRFGDYFLTIYLLHFRGISMPLLIILSAFKQKKNRQRFLIFG